MNKTIYKILIIIFAILFLGSLGSMRVMGKIDKQTENTTTEFTATVNHVKVNDSMQQADIYTNELDAFLFIAPGIGEHINLDDVKNLTSGQTIYFRIENMYTSGMHESIFLAITELKTETKDIFTLEEYNEYTSQTIYPTRITGIVFTLASLVAIVICWIKMKKVKSTNGTENGSV